MSIIVISMLILVIIFSIIAWCGLVEPGFESSRNSSLDCEGKGLSRVGTQAYNWPIWGSVSDPCPCLYPVQFFKHFSCSLLKYKRSNSVLSFREEHNKYFHITYFIYIFFIFVYFVSTVQWFKFVVVLKPLCESLMARTWKCL